MTLSATVLGRTADSAPVNNTTTAIVTVADQVPLETGASAQGSLGSIELALLLLALGVALTMRRRATLLLAVAGVGMALMTYPASDAHAEYSLEYYVGGSVGEASANVSASDLSNDLTGRGWSVTNVNVDDSDSAWKIFAGMNFHEYFGAELAYVDLGQVKTSFVADIPPSQVDQFVADTSEAIGYLAEGLSVAGTGRIEFGEWRWTLLGKLGFFIYKSESSVAIADPSGQSNTFTFDNDETDMMYALGGKVYPFENVGFRFEWERYKLKEWADMLSIGVEYRFQ